MIPKLLADVGQALYGPHWVASLTEALGVSPRTMRRWMNGTADIPPGIAADLRRIICDMQMTLSALTRQLEMIS